MLENSCSNRPLKSHSIDEAGQQSGTSRTGEPRDILGEKKGTGKRHGKGMAGEEHGERVRGWASPRANNQELKIKEMMFLRHRP